MTRIQRKINWIKMHALQESQQPVSDPFITTWNMTSGEFTLLTQTGTYFAKIDWGDGTSSIHTTGSPTHTYASAGQYQISITGQYNGLRIDYNETQRSKLIAVNAWGNVGFTSFERAFRSCSNLVSLPVGSITGADNVKSFNNCFYGCTSLATIPLDLFRYNVNVTTFARCFANCTSLATIPLDLFRYNVNVTTFLYCFYGCQKLALPTSIFDLSALQTKQPDMAYCFLPTSSVYSPTGRAQPVWNYVTITVKNSCFRNCTALTNYSQIPELWRQL